MDSLAVFGSPSLWLRNDRAMLNIIRTLDEVACTAETIGITTTWSGRTTGGAGRWSVIRTGELKHHGVVVHVHVHLRSGLHSLSRVTMMKR